MEDPRLVESCTEHWFDILTVFRTEIVDPIRQRSMTEYLSALRPHKKSPPVEAADAKRMKARNEQELPTASMFSTDMVDENRIMLRTESDDPMLKLLNAETIPDLRSPLTERLEPNLANERMLNADPIPT
jgi:hypothetical protein